MKNKKEYEYLGYFSSFIKVIEKSYNYNFLQLFVVF